MHSINIKILRILNITIIKFHQFYNVQIFFEMRIVITDLIKFSAIDVQPQQEIENIKALIEVQFGIPMDKQILFFQSKQLKGQNTINKFGIKQDSLITVSLAPNPVKKTLGIAEIIKKQAKNSANKQPQMPNFGLMTKARYIQEAKKLKLQIQSEGLQYQLIKQKDQQLAQALLNQNINVLADVLQKRDEKIQKQRLEKQKKFLELSKDPFNPEYQKLLEERINLSNVENNRQYAEQFVPEVFGSVCMLYINAQINKVPIQAFVDSGAQTTVMSQVCAQRCGVMRLVDKRYAGTAVGVGNCKIIGRVHAAQIMIEGKFITCSLTVVQNNNMEFLLGLDMLKRFNCQIDLKKNSLIFQDIPIETRFLSEGEVQKYKQKLQTEKPKNKQKVLPEVKKNPQVKKPNTDEQKIKRLENLGFGRKQSIQALHLANGNEQIAAGILSQKRFGF